MGRDSLSIEYQRIKHQILLSQKYIEIKSKQLVLPNQIDNLFTKQDLYYLTNHLDFEQLIRLQKTGGNFCLTGFFTKHISSTSDIFLSRQQVNEEEPEENAISATDMYVKCESLDLQLPIGQQIHDQCFIVDTNDQAYLKKFLHIFVAVTSEQLLKCFGNFFECFRQPCYTQELHHSFHSLRLKLFFNRNEKLLVARNVLDCFLPHQLLNLKYFRLNLAIDKSFLLLESSQCGLVLSNTLESLTLTISLDTELPSFPTFRSLQYLSIRKRKINPQEISFLLINCEKLECLELEYSILQNGYNFLQNVSQNRLISCHIDRLIKQSTKLTSFVIKSNNITPIQTVAFFLAIMPQLKYFQFYGNLGETCIDSDSLLKHIPEQQKKHLQDYLNNNSQLHLLRSQKTIDLEQVKQYTTLKYSLQYFEDQFCKQEQSSFVNVFNRNNYSSDDGDDDVNVQQQSIAQQILNIRNSSKFQDGRQHNSIFSQGRSHAVSLTKDALLTSFSSSLSNFESEETSENEFGTSIGFMHTDVNQEIIEIEKREVQKTTRRTLAMNRMRSISIDKKNLVSNAVLLQAQESALSTLRKISNQYKALPDYIIEVDSQSTDSKHLDQIESVKEIEGQFNDQDSKDDSLQENEYDNNPLAAQTIDLSVMKQLQKSQVNKRQTIASLFQSKKYIEMPFDKIRLKKQSDFQTCSRIMQREELQFDSTVQEFNECIVEQNTKLKRQYSAFTIDYSAKRNSYLSFNDKKTIFNNNQYALLKMQYTGVFKSSETALNQLTIEIEQHLLADDLTCISLQIWQPKIYETMYLSSQTIQFSNLRNEDKQSIFQYYQNLNDQKFQNSISVAISNIIKNKSLYQQSLKQMCDQSIYGQRVVLNQEQNQLLIPSTSQLNRLYLIMIIPLNVRLLNLPQCDFNFKEFELILTVFPNLEEFISVSIPNYTYMQHNKLQVLNFTNQGLFNVSLVDTFPKLLSISFRNVVFAGKYKKDIKNLNYVKIGDSKYIDEPMLLDFVLAIRPKHLILKDTVALSEDVTDALGIVQLHY